MHQRVAKPMAASTSPNYFLPARKEAEPAPEAAATQTGTNGGEASHGRPSLEA